VPAIWQSDPQRVVDLLRHTKRVSRSYLKTPSDTRADALVKLRQLFPESRPQSLPKLCGKTASGKTHNVNIGAVISCGSRVATLIGRSLQPELLLVLPHKRFVKRERESKRMRFAYEGFTQDGDRRCFLFRGIEAPNPTNIFSIEVELPLLAQNRVQVQDGPMFCLQLLTTASVGGSSCLNRFLSYRVVGEDLRPLLVERGRREAEGALRKQRYRRPIKRSSTSNLHLGTLARGH
jgi:hypothetical protein